MTLLHNQLVETKENCGKKSKKSPRRGRNRAEEKGLKRVRRARTLHDRRKAEQRQKAIMRRMVENEQKGKGGASYMTDARIDTMFRSAGFAKKMGKKARKVNFVQREGKLKPVSLAKAALCVVGEGCEDKSSLASICRKYNQSYNGGNIQEKPMWNRFASAGCAAFFDEVLDEVQERCNEMAAMHPYREGQELIYILNNKFGFEIEDVYLQDGTYWRLQESLADQYPGTRSNEAAKLVEDTFDENGDPIYEKKKVAGIGFQTQMSMKTGTIKCMTVTPETANEKEFVQVHEAQRALYIMDSGYCKYALFEKIANTNSLFLSKCRSNCAAIIESAKIWSATPHGVENNAQDYIGMKISDAMVLAKKRRQNLDCRCVLSNGLRVRMVIFNSYKINRETNRKENNVVLLVTNIFNMPPLCITDLYRVRWQIEILFKEFKSGNVLRLSNVTKNQNILHMLMSASLTTYLLKHMVTLFISHFAEDVSPLKIQTKFTDFKRFLDAYVTHNVDVLKDIMKGFLDFLPSCVKSKTSRKRTEEKRSLRAVLDSLAQTLTPPAFIECLMQA